MDNGWPQPLKTERGETCNERLSWNLHNYKLHKLVSLLSLLLLNFSHIVWSRGYASGSWFSHILARVHLFVGWLLALPSLYPLFYFQLPWIVINKSQVYAAISILAHFCSYKKKKKKKRKDLFPILFKFFITQINTIRVLRLSSLHSPEPASVGNCRSLSNVHVRRVIFSPHTKFILITSSEMLGVASLPYATTPCLCPATSAL